MTRTTPTALALLAAGAALTLGVAQPASARPADSSPPVVTYHPMRYLVGTSLSSSSTTDAGLPMTFSWSQSDADGICDRTARLSDNALGGDYPDIRPGATSYTADIGQTALLNSAELDMSTTDCAGHYSSGFQEMRNLLVQEGSFDRSSGWRSQSCTCWSGGSVIGSTRKGASASYRFVGQSFALIGVTGPDRGSADVYVDGVKTATVDTRTSRARHDRVVLAAASFRSAGTHTITVRSRSDAPVQLDALAYSYP